MKRLTRITFLLIIYAFSSIINAQTAIKDTTLANTYFKTAQKYGKARN